MFEVLHETEAWTVGRWRCPGDQPAAAVDEIADLHEVVVPIAGTFHRRRGRAEILASPVTGVLADAGDGYTVGHPVADDDRCLVYLLREAALDDLARATGAVEGGSIPRFRCHEVRVPARLHLAASRLFSRGDGRGGGTGEALCIESEAAGVLSGVLEAVGAAQALPEMRVTTVVRHRRAVARAAAFMSAHLGEGLTLEQISKAAGYSPFHFARIFRRVTGTSPYRYLMQLRLRAVAAIVADGEVDLSRIALRTGFSSHSHMSAAFREAFGRTPSSISAGIR